MAEIRVEQKRRSLAWLWILLVLALIAAGVWYFYFNNGVAVRTDTGARTERVPAVAAVTSPTPAPTAAPGVAARAA